MLRVLRGQHTHPIVSSLGEKTVLVPETMHWLYERLAPLNWQGKAKVDVGRPP